MQVNDTISTHALAETLGIESGKFGVTVPVRNLTTKGLVSMKKVFLMTFLTAATLLMTSGVAYSDSITASVFTPLAPDGVNPVILDLQPTNPTVPPLTPNSGPGFTCNVPPCTSTGSFGIPGNPGAITGNGYSITANVASFEGVVRGALPGTASRSGFGIPVAGVRNNAPLYLTGNFSSPTTSINTNAGQYLSTGASSGTIPATITISFASPETSLALLWGSIDPRNTLTFTNGNTTVFSVTGTQAQTAANTLFGENGLGNGFLGVGGSAYFVIDTTMPFTAVTATNASPGPGNFPSFELTGVAAAEAPFMSTPEPAALWMLPIGLGMIVALVGRRRRQRDVLHS
jgi:hypothetical protein